ncbi:MAG: hypothetical protein HQ537_01805 [Parcubacteria group bacterium]|nr:hypothetical protein [Parcubacteria group bacterium]
MSLKEKPQEGKISKEEFALILFRWVFNFLTDKKIREIAKSFGFKIRSDEDLRVISEELFFLNIWLVVYTCEGSFRNVDKRNKCLDIFHKFVYEKLTDKGKSFKKWMKMMSMKYIEYDKALKTEHPSTSLWVLSTLINKNLFGKVKEDPLLQMKITAHIGIFVKHLGKIIKQCDIN